MIARIKGIDRKLVSELARMNCPVAAIAIPNSVSRTTEPGSSNFIIFVAAAVSPIGVPCLIAEVTCE